jgi:uncharacterized protein YkwD
MIGPALSLAIALAGSNDVDTEKFLKAFNDYRAEHELPPVELNQALTDDAAQNNELQQRHGLGHHFMGRAYGQNSAWNYTDVDDVMQGWDGSSGHRANMLRSWTCMGIHKDGPYWTQNFARGDACPE